MRRAPLYFWSRRHSLALSLAAASAAMGAAVMLAAGVIGYVSLSNQLEVQTRAELEGKQALLVHLISKLDNPQAVAAQRHEFDDFLKGHEEMTLQLSNVSSGETLHPLFSQSGAIVSLAPTLSAVIAPSAQRKPNTSLVFNGTVLTKNGEGVNYSLQLDGVGNQQLLAAYLRALLVGVPALLVIVLIGAWWVARTGLAPLSRLARLANESTTTSLSKRIATNDLPDELHSLANNFNQMLNRLEGGISKLDQFSGDLAHEMRTPVANILGRSQVALSQTRTVDELKAVVESSIEEMERLARLISDMLFLARADNEQEHIEHQDLKLEAEVRKICEFLDVVADEAKVSFSITGKADIKGDQILIQRALTNLLSNAIRHSHSGTAIHTSIEYKANYAEVRICNIGAQITDDQLPHLFDRFYRVDRGRSRNDGGTGLGLSIVHTIMILHGGTVTATSEASAAPNSAASCGTIPLAKSCFCLRFPVAATHTRR
jgi:two-component system, OmpR family, heavy metal sensor histidine kinase CusS